jgi:hypothetical protein
MTPNPKIQALIKSMGIIPESEHYEIAELIVKECISIVEKDAPISAMYVAQHFGVEE